MFTLSIFASLSEKRPPQNIRFLERNDSFLVKILQSIPFVKEILEAKKIDECIAIEGYCALHLINDSPKFSISFKNKADTHSVVCNNDKILHKSLLGVEKKII